MDEIEIRVVAPEDFPVVEMALAEIVADGVNGGAAISFMQPYTPHDGLRFWREKVFPDVADGKRVLFAAYLNSAIVGTVQMDIALPPNQPHRCEVAKMVVHARARRKGVARQLMLALEERAKSIGKTLITLDTRTGDSAEGLYTSVGFRKAGVIPQFALDPDGRGFHATTYMYKEI
ncbi:MAG TPA: GNAT family N-acetyltransferase [Methylocystis sp.]|nr:GNAT family N-acetyltransferase [Methylocystis sp.]